MLMKSVLTALAAGLLNAGMLVSSNAAVTVHTTQESFLSVVTNAQVDNLNNIPGPTFSSPRQRTTASAGDPTGWVYRLSSSSGDFLRAGTVFDIWLSTTLATSTITLEPLLGFGPVLPGATAIGGYFFANDASGAFLSGQTVQIIATDLNGATSLTLTNASSSAFTGFTSDSRITSLQISVLQGSTPAFPAVNNVMLAIPEPHTYALFALGLTLIIGRAQRRSV